MESGVGPGAELVALFEWVTTFDVAGADVGGLDRFLRATRTLRSHLFAREASGTVWCERRQREQANPNPNGSWPNDADGDDGDGATGAGGASDGDDEASLPPLPADPPESPEDRQRRLLRAKWLQRCEMFAEALSLGSITAAHVDVLASSMERVEPTVMADVLADETGLLIVAQTVTPRSFGAHLRRVIDRVRADGGMKRLQRQQRDSHAWFRTDDDTDMYKLFCELDPVRGKDLFAVLQARVDAMYQTKGATDGLTPGQVKAQALFDLVCGQRDDTGSNGSEALVIVDHQTLVSGEHAHTVCETNEGVRLAVPYVQGLCGAAAITAAIAGADGAILAVGCAERLANREQRRALRAMYRSCAHPGCRVPFPQCQIHHVLPWEDRGPTDLENLLPLCFEHHHLVHDGGWRLTIDAQRTLRWYRPDGTLQMTTPFEPLLTPISKRQGASGGQAPATNEAEGPAPGPAPPTTDAQLASKRPSVADGRRAARRDTDAPSLFDEPPAA